MRDGVGLQQAGDAAGRKDRRLGARIPPWSPRIVRRGLEHHGYSTRGGGHRHQPLAGGLHDVRVEAPELVEDAEGLLDRGRLTHRAAEVGLQRAAETAVRILVGAQRGDDPIGVTAAEQALESQAVEQPRVAPHEPLRGS